MERFVCELAWKSRISWIASIATGVAVVVFGAPAEAFIYLVAAELLFFTAGEAWCERRRPRP